MEKESSNAPEFAEKEVDEAIKNNNVLQGALLVKILYLKMKQAIEE